MNLGHHPLGAALRSAPPRGTSTAASQRTGEKCVESAVWKLWLLRWIGLYPTLLVLCLLLGPLIGAWPLPVRVLLMSGLGTWSLSFVLMPRLTRWFAEWLHRPGLDL